MGTPRRPALALALGAALSVALPGASALAGGHASGSTTVIIRTSGSHHAAESAVRRLGGAVTRRLTALHQLVATVPSSAISTLRTASGVRGVSEDAQVTLNGVGPDGTDSDALGSLSSVARMIGADTYWQAGFTGQDVDVAIIDSGVTPVKGLDLDEKLFQGPDLSFESQDADLRHLDTYGHGTNMAAIIAGNDTGDGMHDGGDLNPNDAKDFYGIAPGARIVSLKVADAFGATDVSQVIAAIDWVIHNKDKHSLHIRVLNLSFGTNGVQDYKLDPLAFAVEQAWKKGIFVVVSAGNEGYGTKKLNDPAYDPLIMAVGAADPQGTLDIHNDTVAEFSSGGDSQRHPDVVAPGTGIVSLRVPNSFLDQRYPLARQGTSSRLFRGSGTSQAAAVVSGAAALVLDQRGDIKPNQLKKLLSDSAVGLAGERPTADGHGEINLATAFSRATPTATSSAQGLLPATGLGSLDASRGSFHLDNDGVKLTGEKDIFGRTLNLVDWVKRSAGGDAFDDKGKWMGVGMTGDNEDNDVWRGRSWTNNDWSGRSWTSDAWTGRSWTGSEWTGSRWQGRSWTSGTWSGNVWSSSTWT